MDGRSGKKIRMGRIFRPQSGRSLIVAYSHGVLRGPIPGMQSLEEMRRMVGMLADADGIMISPGLVDKLEDAFVGRNRPALILMLDWQNYSRGYADGVSAAMASLEEALAAGADAVMTYMWIGHEDPRQEREEVARNVAVCRTAERLGLPVMVESRAVSGETGPDGKYPVELLKLHTRMAAEIGADFIKTKYTGDPESFAEVVDSCPVPILIAGGPKSQNAFEVAREAIAAGAAGLVYGRNIFQQPDPTATLQQYLALVHGEKTTQ